jgi:hypothetical protein
VFGRAPRYSWGSGPIIHPLDSWGSGPIIHPLLISRNEEEAYCTVVCITVFIPMAFSLVKIQNVVKMCDGLFSGDNCALCQRAPLSKPPVSREVSQFLSEDCAMMDIAHSLVSLSLGVNSSVDRASWRQVKEFVCK